MATPNELQLAPPPAPNVSPAENQPINQALAPPAAGFTWLPLLFISLFALLLASFPARNAELWMNLAAGRDLVHGDWNAARELTAISPATHATPFANWLYDLVCYALYSVVGGAGLVLFKAVLVVLVALVLMRLSHTGQGWWIATICTALALLAMSMRLLLQPATVSYLFLAVTLWLLWRRPEETETRNAPSAIPSWLPPWQLLLLFVVWVNLDSWFLLGLGVVALIWLGQVLDKPLPGCDRVQSLLYRAVQLGILAAACLLSPSHVYAFAQVPGREWFTYRTYLTGSATTPAGLAFLPLLGLGLLLFFLNLPRWHSQGFLPWIGLAVLSTFQVRAIPFFAVVAGPILAWNLQEFFALHTEAERRKGPLWGVSLIALRVLTIVIGLAFLVSAWPGWLQGQPYEPRRWALEPVPSLAAAAKGWHEEGKLSVGTRTLHLSPDTVYAFAWFCPEQKGQLDTPDHPDELDKRMRSAGTDTIVVYNAALDPFLEDSKQWPLLYLRGDLAVFGWRDPTKPETADRFQGMELNLERLAFDPAELKRAPAKAPVGDPDERRPWDVFRKPIPVPIDREEAQLHLQHAEAFKRAAPARHITVWEASHSASLVSAVSSWTGPVSLFDAHMRLLLIRPPMPEEDPTADDTTLAFAQQTMNWQLRFTRPRDDSPPALLYLAIRAARRAVAANPTDALAYLTLGEAYVALLRDTRERYWGTVLPDLLQLRQVQAAAALHQALVLRPDLSQAHLQLGWLCRDLNYFDLALEHLQTYHDLVSKQDLTIRGKGKGSAASGPGTKFTREQKIQFEEQLHQLAKLVEEREKTYTNETTRMRLLDRAMKAVEKGLGGKAANMLLESDISYFGPQGMALEFALLLKMGRSRDVIDWSTPEQEEGLGVLGYHMVRMQALAALGDYALAQEECSLLAGGDPNQQSQFARRTSEMICQALVNEHPGPNCWPLRLMQAMTRSQFYSNVAELARTMKQRAEQQVLQGLLALEEGDVDAAEVAFRLALTSWKDDARVSAGSGPVYGSWLIATTCLEWLARGRQQEMAPAPRQAP